MRRILAGSVAALLLGAALVGCGGEDGSGGTRPTLAPTRSPTLPSPTRSEAVEPTDPAGSDSEDSGDTSEPEPTRTPTRQPESTSDQPDEPTSEPSGSADEDATDEPTDAESDDSPPSWLWWLLAAVVLGAIVAIPLVRRARRRAAWRRQLSEAEGELSWLARELLPGLRHVGSREQVAGAWTVASPRVTAAEDALTVLESTAPDDLGRSRAQALRNASRLARQRMEMLIAPGPHDTWSLDLDAIMADLEAALGPPSPA